MSSADVDWAMIAQGLRQLPRRASRSVELRRSAVLVPLSVDAHGALHALFTRRVATLKAHAGQVSFPGGGIGEGETPIEAALREAEEEVGLSPASVEVLGLLHDVETSTGFVLTPIVARVPHDDSTLLPNPGEVARAFRAPLAELATRLELRAMERAGKRLQVPFFPFDGELIWGATGRVVLDLLKLLELAPPFEPPPLAHADEEQAR
jgi:8-oxo-dGTP pyrophosphatase MutT (NUDIX family)